MLYVLFFDGMTTVLLTAKITEISPKPEGVPEIFRKIDRNFHTDLIRYSDSAYLF